MMQLIENQYRNLANQVFNKDEDGEVVYSTVVYPTLAQVTLPSALAGDYVIELSMGNWLFAGWKEL